MKLKGKQFDTILNIQKASIKIISRPISKEDFQRSFLKLYIVFLRKKYISNDYKI